MTTASDTSGPWPRIVGRYELHEPFASGGMASVHFGRLRGDAGFSRPVAIKRLHPQFASDPDFVAMFLDEARLASRVRHPCVVAVHDVVSTERELFLVMDYVSGETLSRLLRAPASTRRRMPEPIASRVFVDALSGLHAAHEACDEAGVSLDIVHRDVSPQNVLLGADGITRIVDFGIAKANGRMRTTRGGELKGKLAYMAPEQVRGERVTRLVDVYAAAVTLWEALTGARLFEAENDASLMMRVLQGQIVDPRAHVPELTPALAAAVMRALSLDPAQRFPTAEAMAQAIADARAPTTHAEVASWMREIARETLTARAQTLAAIEKKRTSAAPPAGRTSAPSLPSIASVFSSSSEPLTSAPPPTARRRRAAVWGLVGAGVAAIAGSIAAISARSQHAQAAPTATAATDAPAPPSAEPSASAALTSTAPMPTAPASRATDASIDAQAPPPPRATARPVPPRSPGRPSATGPTKTVSCETPFYVDSSGVRRYKPECFR